MSNLRVLIVDDEPIARKILREELLCLSGVDIIGEAENGRTALMQIKDLLPDLVFLDIQMPMMGGFELLHQLKGGHLPVFVMVTAFNQHAVQAFEAGAIDYLLKPVSQSRLYQAVDRASRLRGSPLLKAENLAHLQTIPIEPSIESTLKPRSRKIVGRQGEDYFLLDPDEVLAFQATGDNVSILTTRHRYLATQNLRTLEEKLDSGLFRRIHRNALVNVNQIRKMSMITSQRWLITLNNGHEFVVSKRQARSVRDVLHW